MENVSLEYIELEKSGVSEAVLKQFDCGNEDMTDYLHNDAKQDAITGCGVTYVLVSPDRDRIYAYATIKTHSLCYYDDAEQFHTNEADESGKVLLSIPAVEIKMFAISRKLKGVRAVLLDPVNQQHYSSIFFKWLLEKLYYMSMDTIGFQMIFLRANNEGERLYRNNKFIECGEYLRTYDVAAEGCTPLVITLSEIEEVIFG